VIIVVASAAGVPLGLWLRRDLATLRYRKEEERELPQPGPRWWVLWASILALGGIAAAAAFSVNPLSYLALLPLAVAGPWLAAVDFDVLRIPNRVLVPTSAATLLAVVGAPMSVRDWRALIVPLASALLTGGMFVTSPPKAASGSAT
jgi:leader peptidase (prepilin peptidase)/N-methyltransferase